MVVVLILYFLLSTGSFATATCQRCGHKVDAQAIKEDIFTQRIPKCSQCRTEEEKSEEQTEEVPNKPDDEGSSTQKENIAKSIHLMHHRPPGNLSFMCFQPTFGMNI